MRVMVVSPVFPPARGGIETLAHEIALALHDTDLVVVTAEQEGHAVFDAGSSLSITRVGNVPRGGRRTQARLTVRAIGRALRWRPDVTIAMEVRCGTAAWLVRLLTGGRWLQYWHAKEIATWPRQAGFARRRADAHVAVSRHTRALLDRVGPSPAPTTVLPPGIDLGAIARSSQFADASAWHGQTMLTIARMEHAYKGHDVVLEAMPTILASAPAARWIVVGDGPVRGPLERRARELGVSDQVDFLGQVSDAERDALLATSTVFVMPSRVPDDAPGGEGFGIVYIEAAAHGLPSIAADEGGATDAVAHGRSGLLVDPRSPSAVADASLTVLTDAEGWLRMSHGAREWAERFDWRTIGAEVRRLVRELGS